MANFVPHFAVQVLGMHLQLPMSPDIIEHGRAWRRSNRLLYSVDYFENALTTEEMERDGWFWRDSEIFQHLRSANNYMSFMEMRDPALPFVPFQTLCSWLIEIHALNLLREHLYANGVPYFWLSQLCCDVACYALSYYLLLSGIIYDLQAADLNFNQWANVYCFPRTVEGIRGHDICPILEADEDNMDFAAFNFIPFEEVEIQAQPVELSAAEAQQRALLQELEDQHFEDMQLK